MPSCLSVCLLALRNASSNVGEVFTDVILQSTQSYWDVFLFPAILAPYYYHFLAAPLSKSHGVTVIAGAQKHRMECRTEC